MWRINLKARGVHKNSEVSCSGTQHEKGIHVSCRMSRSDMLLSLRHHCPSVASLDLAHGFARGSFIEIFSEGGEWGGEAGEAGESGCTAEGQISEGVQVWSAAGGHSPAVCCRYFKFAGGLICAACSIREEHGRARDASHLQYMMQGWKFGFVIDGSDTKWGGLHACLESALLLRKASCFQHLQLFNI